jgi:protoporphyrinogen oxidase
VTRLTRIWKSLMIRGGPIEWDGKLMKGRVVIIGAGAAGLTTAYRLSQRDDIEIVLLEKDQAPGGRVRTKALPEGYFADDSAQFLAGNYQRTFRLMREIGVYEQLEEVRAETFSAIYRDGRIFRLPATVTGLITTGTFGIAEKLSLLRLAIACAVGYRREASVRPSLLQKYDHIKMSEYVASHFGERVLDEVVDPFVAMSMSYGDELSLVYGLGTVPIALAKHYVLPRGNGTLTQHLASACPPIRLGDGVKRIVGENNQVVGVELERDGSLLQADAVVCATPAHSAAPLLASSWPELATFLERVPYSACVHALFGTRAPYLPCWGLVIPRSHGSLVTYVTEETFKSKCRAPDRAGLTQAFVIGEDARKLMEGDDEAIGDRIWDEIRRLLPRYPERRFSRVIRRQHAMVIGPPGYQGELARFNEAVSRVKGLYLISDYQTNPLIEGSVYLGERTAQQILG